MPAMISHPMSFPDCFSASIAGKMKRKHFIDKETFKQIAV
jgi:hypothetical protein